MLVPLTAFCIAAAANHYQVPESDMWTLLYMEGGHVGAVSRNKNATFDIGPFQINSSWISRLRASDGASSGSRTLLLLRDDGCINAAVAALIYSRALQEARGDRKLALGLYHSHAPQLRTAYADRAAEIQRRYFSNEKPAF